MPKRQISIREIVYITAFFALFIPFIFLRLSSINPRERKNVILLTQKLNSKNLYVQRNAIKALAEINDVSAITPLTIALENKDAFVRQKAISGLGRIDDSRATRSLICALENDDKVVRYHAREALKTIKILPDDILTQALERENLRIIAGTYFFFIQKGIQGSEQSLIRALDAYGDKNMTEDYLNSGNAKLAGAARSWAEKHGIPILQSYGKTAFTWKENK